MEEKKKILIPGNGPKIKNYQDACFFIGVESCLADEFTSPEGFTGLLIPGGCDIHPSIYGSTNMGSRLCNKKKDLYQLKEIAAFVEAGLPVFGICRGLQLINVFLGGTLNQDIPGHLIENEGTHEVFFNEFCPELMLADEVLVKERFKEGNRWRASAMVNSTHHQCINQLAEGLTVFACSDDGIPEGIIHKSGKILGVQWHPERMMEKGGLSVFKEFILMQINNQNL